MSMELINRISIKKDGVYVSTHSSNDTVSYHSVKIDIFTQAYLRGGQSELDKKIIDMYFYNCDFRGNHKSILPYKEAIEKAINDKKFIEIRNEYDLLCDKAFYIANRFPEYKNLTEEEANKMYDELKQELEKLRNRRNEYVADLVEKERRKLDIKNQIVKKCILIERADEEYSYNVQIWTSVDCGKNFCYAGNGKFFKTLIEVGNYIDNLEKKGIKFEKDRYLFNFDNDTENEESEEEEI